MIVIIAVIFFFEVITVVALWMLYSMYEKRIERMKLEIDLLNERLIRTDKAVIDFIDYMVLEKEEVDEK